LLQEQIDRETRMLRYDRIPLKVIVDVFERWREQDPRHHTLESSRGAPAIDARAGWRACSAYTQPAA
jgi:hypothetical protein